MAAARWALSLVLATGCAMLVGACGGAGEPEDARGVPASADSLAELPVAPDSVPTDVIEDDLPPPNPVPVITGGGAQPSTGSQPASGPSTGGRPQPQPQPRQEQTQAQQDDGAAILRRASAAYSNVRSMKADFVVHYTNPLTKQDVTSRGTLYQRRPDRIALRFTHPAGDLILSDGEYFYQYYPSVNAQQATRVQAGAADQSKVDLQAQFLGNPVERFDYTLHGSENVGGRPAQVLTLVPKGPAEYRSLKVWIDTRDALARRFEITERNGVVRRFDLSGLEMNASIPDAVFRFTAPDGVRVITAG